MRFRFTQKTAPSVEPITTAEAKAHLNVTSADDDTYIDTLVVAARQKTESYLNRSLITQTWNLYLDKFESKIILPRAPIQSVSSIKYIDTNGAEQTLSSAVYTVDTDAEPGQVYLAYEQSWPDIRTMEKAVDVEYIAGYGDAGTDVPQVIKQAMLLLVGHYYERREETIVGTIISTVPMAYEPLLSEKRIMSA